MNTMLTTGRQTGGLAILELSTIMTGELITKDPSPALGQHAGAGLFRHTSSNTITNVILEQISVNGHRSGNTLRHSPETRRSRLCRHLSEAIALSPGIDHQCNRHHSRFARMSAGTCSVSLFNLNSKRSYTGILIYNFRLKS